MRDNASWGFYRLSDVYAHTLSSYNACFWPRSLACDYSNKAVTSISDLDAFLAAVGGASRGHRKRRRRRTRSSGTCASAIRSTCDDAIEKPCARERTVGRFSARTQPFFDTRRRGAPRDRVQ